MNSTVYAPVVIPTLCRYTHFKRCVESLARNTGADQTELYIGLDYPTKETHWDGYRKLCDYIPTIQGFKNVVVYKRESNFGPMRNARDILAVVQKKYDCYIFSEDDNEFSPNFLQYINGGLQKFKNDANVIAICGFAEPRVDYKCLNSYPYNAYPMCGYNAWGVGVWFEKKPPLIPAKEILYDEKTVLKVIGLGHGRAVHRMLYRMRTGAISDLQWRIFCALNHKYCIFPKISKVRNWGFDGSGENSLTINHYSIMDIDLQTSFTMDDFEVRDYPQIKRIQKSIFGWKPLNYIVFALDYLLFRISKGKCFTDFKLYRYIVYLNRKING